MPTNAVSPTPFSILIDTGGTFTDCVAIAPDGEVRRAKVLSSGALRGRVRSVDIGPDDARAVLRIELGADLSPSVLRGLALCGLDDGCLGHVVDVDGDRLVIAGFDGKAISLTAGITVEFRGADDAAPMPAPILAAHVVTETPADRPLPPMLMRLATTRATNALLERRGARCALLVNEGFEDLLKIGDQRRPDLFARTIIRPQPLTDLIVAVPSRIAADGETLVTLDDEICAEIERRLRALSTEDAPIETVAVALLHAWAHPAQEERLATFLREHGWPITIASSALAPAIGLLDRARTTVTEAFLSPIMRSHLADVASALGDGGRLDVLTSAGGLVAADRYRAVDGLLSGPAGGVAGAAAVAQRCGVTRVLTFDMGGTSTDVARIDGRPQHRPAHQVGGVTIVAPALAIETVAAGGGSICDFDGMRLSVGPESAGADPGPACYGRGGPLTITDVNLVLGRLATDRFGIPIDPDASEGAADALWSRVKSVRDDIPDRAAMLEGLLELADERMADAMAAVSIRQGADPADYAIVAFGGAGGLHACGVAERLGATRVIIPADAGLLSAVGLGTARLERVVNMQVLRALDDDGALDDALEQAATRAIAELRASAPAGTEIEARERAVQLRVPGQEASIDLCIDAEVEPTALALEFTRAYAALFHHDPPDVPLEIESVRVIATVVTGDDAAAGGAGMTGASATAVDDGAGRDANGDLASTRLTSTRWAGREHRTTVHRVDRRQFVPDGGDDSEARRSALARVTGPALLLQAHGSVAVPPDWHGVVDGDGGIDLRRREDAPIRSRLASAPLEAELAAARLGAIADEMGELLQRTALSTNVRERLDFSCGILDADGTLVANAPHVPVHLGALGPCVRAVAAACPVAPDDVLITNHPACGGSHLPDVTVLMPVHHFSGKTGDGADEGGAPTLIGWVASRAHHAEIGGIRPGSMAPDAKSLAEEGVVIAPMHLIEGGRAHFGRLRRLLVEAPWPSRSPDSNLADIRAAVAACAHGAASIDRLAAELGPDRLARHMRGLAEHAEMRCRAALEKLAKRIGSAPISIVEHLDDGTDLSAEITAHPTGGETTGDAPLLTLRLGGTAHPGNLNATPAIALSVVTYVLRLLVDEPLPLNEGLLKPVRIELQPGILSPDFPDDPAECPAVGGGNTETSQRLADLLMRALGIMAGSQGTMNNVAFGNDRYSHYETVGGGAGASEIGTGADGVHTHMTNTRITDPEVLEHRMPVRVERFSLRVGSGGSGRHRGGNGLVRTLRFLEAASVSMLTQRRVEGPPGLDGGGDGAPGRQRLFRADGSAVELAPLCAFEVAAGDLLALETPGGGAWGSSENAATKPAVS